MDYNSIKQQIDSTRRQIAETKRKLSKNREEQTAVKNSLTNTENSYQDKLRVAKKEAFDKYISQQTKAIDDRILELSEKINEENGIYEERSNKLENADISEFYTDESEILADVKTSVEILQKHLEKFLSKRFKTELETQLDSGSIEMQSDNLTSLVNYFNKESKYISKLNNENAIDSIIVKINEFCVDNPFTISDDKKKADLQLGGLVFVAGALIILVAKVMFPFYFIFLAFFASYNVIKNYKIFSALIAQKAVKDNVNKIDTRLREEAEKRLEEEKKSLEEKHLETLADLESKLVKEKDNLNSAKVKAETSFIFDDSESRKAYDTAININTKKIDSLIAEEQEAKQQLEAHYAELRKLEEDMNRVAGDIQASYLNFEKVGTDIIFDPEFIYDVKNGKPVFFIHPQKGCLFIYDDLNDVIDFIRLLAVQLRIKLNPFSLNISVLDTQFMGVSYIGMQPVNDTKDDSLGKLFQIISSVEDIKVYFEECAEELQRKLRAIRRQFSNIEDYNKFMVASDSLTEGYEFIFFQDPDISYIQNETLLKILNNGDSLGIFMHLFIQKDVFYEYGEPARKLVNSIGKIFVLSEGDYYERARDFVLENLIKAEE